MQLHYIMMVYILQYRINEIHISDRMKERMEWINKMNEMLEENPYTNGNRVTVTYSEESEIVFVTVNGKNSIVMWEGLTEYGLMMKIMRTIDRLYNNV